LYGHVKKKKKKKKKKREVTLGGNVWDREDTQRIQRFQHKARIGIKHVLPRKSKKKKGWKITLKLKKY
jgi:hypothetical protein